MTKGPAGEGAQAAAFEPGVFADAVSACSSPLRVADTAGTALATHELTDELSTFYGGIETPNYYATHLPPPGRLVASGTFSSVAKWSHYLMLAEQTVGIAVFTAKRTGTLKVGPIWMKPEFRNFGYAHLLLQCLPRAASAANFHRIVVSVSEFNWPMIAALTKANYRHSHTLSRHYSERHDEYVYVQDIGDHDPQPASWIPEGTYPDEGAGGSLIASAWIERYFFPVDAALAQWLSKASKRPPSLKAAFIWHGDDAVVLMMPKRGGTLAVLPCVSRGQSWGLTMEAVIQAASTIGARKISVMAPYDTVNGFLVEAAERHQSVQLEAALPRGYFSSRSDILQLAIFPSSRSSSSKAWS